MRKRYLFASGLVVLAILLALVEWQVSFDFGEYEPANSAQTYVFWAVSTLIFLLTVTLGFMLFRTGVKLYFDRQRDREGSRIKTKLVLGALALSLLPVAFLVSFSYGVLNRTIEKWFTRPAEGVKFSLVDTAVALGDEVQNRAQALANWIALMPGVASEDTDFSKLCIDNRIAELRIESADGTRSVCDSKEDQKHLLTARYANRRRRHRHCSRPSSPRYREQEGRDRRLRPAILSTRVEQKEYSETLSPVHPADRALHSVCLHLDCADSRSSDQRADHRPARRRRRSA